MDTLSLCNCSNMNHTPKLIVITGGPGAGKTAILELAKRNFCEHVVALPEAASILFGGGFWRGNNVEDKKCAQRAIFFVQRESEAMAKNKNIAVALCDRGTLDGLAYWPGTPEEFFSQLGTTKEAELKKYSAVIHLRTPAPHHGYNQENPVRIESATEAAAIDEKILHAWADHPNRVVIDSDFDFLMKAARALVQIRNELPECCRTNDPTTEKN